MNSIQVKEKEIDKKIKELEEKEKNIIKLKEKYEKI